MSINPFRRAQHRRITLRSRAGKVALGGAALVALGIGSAMAGLNETGNLNLVVSSTSGFADGYTLDGGVNSAYVAYYGSASPQATAVYGGSSGTGIFSPFLRLAGSGTEQGYNTNGTVQYDTKTGSWTKAMKISDIPRVTQGGKSYFELYSDVNESNSTPNLDLTNLEVYFTGNPNLTGYPFTADPNPTPASMTGAKKEYGFSGNINFRDVNQGSGRFDMRYLVPVAGTDSVANCDYGNAACNSYFILYSKYTGSDGGFEEWKVRSYPHLTITNTPSASYTRTYLWDISKSANPTTIDLFNGQSGPTTPAGSTQWTVGVTKTGYADSAIDAHGTIVVTNTSTLDATVNSVMDAFSVDTSAVTVNCGAVTFPYTLKAGASLTCTYDKALATATDQINTASAILANGAGGTQTQYDDPEPVTFTQNPVNGSIDVTDTNGQSWSGLTGDTTEQYGQDFSCATSPTDAGSHLNTATITQTGKQAHATVTVNCYGLTVANTVNTGYSRTHTWTITKTRVPNSGESAGSLTLAAGEKYLANYQVVIGQTPTDSNFKVTGTVTVTNPAPMVATGVDVADTVGTTAATVDCGTHATTNLHTVNVPAATDATHPGSVTCSYSLSTSSKISATSTGSATFVGVTYSTPSPQNTVTWGSPSPDTDACVTVTDDSGTPAITTDDQTLGTHICAGTTFNYQNWIGPYPSCTTAKFTNTAALVTDDTKTTLTSPFTVNITVPCDTGCTLTQGYWKTHNASFHGGAPVDPTWQQIVPSAEQSPFYLSGTTYFGAMNIAPAGNPYWQLARQYIAAVLNGYNGASQSPVTATLGDALSLFQTYTPTQVANGSKALKAEFTSDASALDNYNQGLAGIPHCGQDKTSAAG